VPKSDAGRPVKKLAGEESKGNSNMTEEGGERPRSNKTRGEKAWRRQKVEAGVWGFKGGTGEGGY